MCTAICAVKPEALEILIQHPNASLFHPDRHLSLPMDLLCEVTSDGMLKHVPMLQLPATTYENQARDADEQLEQLGPLHTLMKQNTIKTSAAAWFKEFAAMDGHSCRDREPYTTTMELA